MIDDGPITLDDYHAMQAVDDGPITLDDLAAFEQPSINDSQIDSQPIHSDAAGFAMQPTPWAVSPGPVAERAPVVAGLPPTDPASYSAYQRREAGNRAGLAADAAAQQAITKGVPYASRLLAGAAGAGAARINEAGGAWRDLVSFYTGGEQTGQPANIINPRAVDELNAMGGTVGDTVGRGIIQNAPAAAELVPIDPVGMASMFLSHPLSKAIAGSAGFSAAKAQFLTELETVAGGRVAALTSNAIDDALGGAAFGGVNAGVRGEDPITGAIEGGAAGAALGGVVRGVGAVAGRMRGAPGEVAPPITDPRAVQSAVNEMRPGAVASPDARTTPPLETPAQSLRPAQSELPLRPGEVPQAVRGSIPQTGEQPASARPETSSLPSDRPSLEALAGRLGIPFTERTRTADLRAAVEAQAASGPVRSQAEPDLPSEPIAATGQEARSQVQSPPTQLESSRDVPSLTPSPAEAEASQTTQSPLSRNPRSQRAPSQNDIRGTEATGESGIPLAREQESGPREAPTPIRTGDTDRTTQTTSSRDSGIDSSPNPTPGEGGAWEPVKVKIVNPDISTRFGVGGEREGFEVANKGGGKIIGRLRDADFPGQKSKESRGELFFAEVPTHLRRKGVASALIKDSMRLMAANGAETVKLTVPSKMGRPMIEALQKRGVLGETIQISEQSGTMEVRNPYFEKTPDLAPKPEASTTTKEPTRGKAQEGQEVRQEVLSPPSTPPPVESRSAGAPISRDERITSARKAMTAADREAMGLGAMDNPGRRGWEEALDTAREKGFNKKETALALAAEEPAPPVKAKRRGKKADTGPETNKLDAIIASEGDEVVFGPQKSSTEFGPGTSQTVFVGLRDKGGATKRAIHIVKERYSSDWKLVESDGYKETAFGSQRIAKHQWKDLGVVVGGTLTDAKRAAERVLRGEIDPAAAPHDAIVPYQPVETSVRAAWRGDYAPDGSKYITDGTMMMLADAVRPRDASKLTANRVPSRLADDTIKLVFDKVIKEANQPFVVVGLHRGIDGDVLYGEIGGKPVAVSAVKYELLKQVTGADAAVSKGAGKPILFTKNGEPVGVLMPRQLPYNYKHADAKRKLSAGTPPAPSPPPPTTGSFADRLEASARDKIKAIDADVAKKRRSLKKGQRLGVAPIFDYLVPYAQIALAKSIRAVNTTGEKVKVLRKYVREALKDSGIVDRKYENRVLTIARAMVKDATDPDGSLSQDRLYEVMDEAQQTFQRPTKGAETKRVIAENTQPQKQDKTITERQALRERFKAQRAAAPEIFKAGEVAGADKQEVKGRSQTIRAMLKMRRMGKAEGIAEGKARLESTLDSIRLARGNVESLQKEAAAAVKRMIPKAQRGDWYTQIRDTKTPAALAQVLNGVKVERARIDGTHDAKWISTEARDANLVRAFGAKSQELQAVRSIVRDAEAYLRDLDSKDMDTVLAAQEDLATAKYEITAALKQAKEENTAKLKGTRLAAAQARVETIDAIKKARTSLPEKGETSGSKEAPMLRRWVRKMYTPATLARSLDGGWKTDGPITRTFKALDGGMEQKHQLRRTYQEGMNALAQKYGYRDVDDALGKISGTLGRQTQETIPVVVGGKRLTKGQALYIAIMDPKAKSHASAGGEFVWDNARDAPKFKLTDGIRSKIYDALPAKDLAMVGEMKRLYNETYFDAVDRVSLRLNGSHLIRQPDYMRIRRYAPGGEGAGEPRAMRQISRRHLEDAGFLKPRTGGKSPIVLGDAMLELLSMGEAASNVAGLAEPARFAEMVLLHGDVRTQIRDVAGDSAVKRVEQIIYGLADQRDTMDTAQKIGREVISNVAASKTTLNWKTWLRQVGGVFPLWTGMEGKYWAKGLKAALDTGMEKDLEGRSGWFWNRWNGGPYSAYVGIQAIPLGADVPGSAFKDAGRATLKQLKMAALQAGRLQMGEAGADIGGAYKAFKQLRSSITVGNWFDSIPARVAYAGKLAEAKDLHPDWSLDRQKNWAAKEAADLFKSTQNTSDWMNASGWQQDASKNAALSPFLTFQSQPAKMTNLAITAFRQGGAARAKFIGAVVMSAAWSAAITGGAMVGRDALNRALHGERLNPKDADDAFNYAKWQFGSDVLGIVPGMGTGINLLRRAISGGYGQSSMDTLVGDVIRSFEEGVGGLVDAIGRLDDPINPYTGRPVKNKRMLTAQEKFLRSLDAIQSSARSAAGDPTVPLTNDLSRVIQTKR